MKLIIAIVQDEDTSRLVNALMKEGFSVTKLATTGGFLRAGNTTLLLGVDPYKYPEDLPVVRGGGGPRCGELPVRTPEDGTAPYLVTDVGMNPFERGNTEPVFDAAPLWVLLTEGIG